MQDAQPEEPAFAQGVEAGSSLGSRFDWYSATFQDVDEFSMVEALALALRGHASLGKGRLGYARCQTIERDGLALARVYTGAARAGEMHVASSGDACDQVVPLLRQVAPNHRVSRADAAIDFAADFATLDDLAVAFAEARRLSYRLVTDSDGGATRYLGATSSDYMVRVYKKSEQLRKSAPERAHTVQDGIVRAEVQVRPPSGFKASVAAMSADAIWGMAKWGQAFAREFLDIEALRVKTHFSKSSDYARALHWLGVQYGPMVRARCLDAGSESVRRDVLAALGLALPGPPA